MVAEEVDDPYMEGRRPDFMSVKQVDILQELKEKCFNRLNSQRKEMIM